MSEFDNYNFLYDSGEPLLFESPFSPSADYPFSSSSSDSAALSSPSSTGEDTTPDLYANTPSPHGDMYSSTPSPHDGDVYSSTPSPHDAYSSTPSPHYNNPSSPHGELAIDFFEESSGVETVACVPPPSFNAPPNPFTSYPQNNAKQSPITITNTINTNTTNINLTTMTTTIKQEKTDAGLQSVIGMKVEQEKQYEQYANAFQYTPTSDENNAALSRKTKRKSRAAAVKAARAPEPVVDDESPEEQQRLKKQRRMIRNRESALQSRLKRKMYIEELEAKVQKFDESTSDLVRDNQRLVQENQRLVCMQENQRLLHLQECQRLLQDNNRLMQENQRLMHENEQLKRGAQVPHGPPLRSAGVFTFVVLFSFGFLFHFEYVRFGQPTPLMSGQIQYTGRVLASVDTPSHTQSSELVLRNSPTYRTTTTATPQPRHLLLYVASEEGERKEKEKEKNEKIIPASNPSSSAATDTTASSSSSIFQMNNRSSYRNKLAQSKTNHSTGGALVSTDPKSIDWQTDTSYFFCSDGETVLPPGHDASPKEKLSIIIPSQLLNLTKFMSGEDDVVSDVMNDVMTNQGEYLVEIICQIRSLSIHPIVHAFAEEGVPVPVTV